ncbi:hypothetical protein SNEBB_003138 [Seison nebaliae]|nr:hypothetical protein SNEBB_003138 [Seison nebaliae]
MRDKCYNYVKEYEEDGQKRFLDGGKVLGQPTGSSFTTQRLDYLNFYHNLPDRINVRKLRKKRVEFPGIPLDEDNQPYRPFSLNRISEYRRAYIPKQPEPPHIHALVQTGKYKNIQKCLAKKLNREDDLIKMPRQYEFHFPFSTISRRAYKTIAPNQLELRTPGLVQGTSIDFGTYPLPAKGTTSRYFFDRKETKVPKKPLLIDHSFKLYGSNQIVKNSTYKHDFVNQDKDTIAIDGTINTLPSMIDEKCVCMDEILKNGKED